MTVEHFGGSSRGTQRLEVDDEMVMHILLDMSFNQIFVFSSKLSRNHSEHAHAQASTRKS